jgi:tetratricopeptide (TPR) repeat protein
MARSTTWCACAGLVACLLTLAASTLAAEPPSKEQQDKLQKRNRYLNQALQLRAAGKRTEAVAALQQALRLQRQLDPKDSTPVVINILTWLAVVQEEQQDWKAVRQSRGQVLTIRTRLSGKKHWQTTDARLALEHVERLEALSQAQRRRLREAAQHNDRAVAFASNGRYPEALPLAEKALAIRKEMHWADCPAPRPRSMA